jgi:D-sedoheptulose 7-phosphate isomerase
MEPRMQGELEAYFTEIGVFGARTEATGADKRAMPLAEAMAWSVTNVGRAKEGRSSIYFVGNGGSAGIASHMAIDWMKNGGFAAAAFNDGASLTCLANDLGFEHVFALPLSRQARPGDVLIAISSSGRSANILAAVAAARAAGASVITLSGFAPDNPLRRLGDINFYVPSTLYGFVEIAHLTICHAMLDIIMGWRAGGTEPVYMPAFSGGAT